MSMHLDHRHNILLRDCALRLSENFLGSEHKTPSFDRFGKRSMPKVSSWRGGGGALSTEQGSLARSMDAAVPTTDMSDLMDETLQLLMKGKKLERLQQVRQALAEARTDNVYL